MATKYAVTGAIADYLGSVDPRQVHGVATLNIAPTQVVMDLTTGMVHTQSVPFDIAPDGTFAPELLDTAATDLSVEPNTLIVLPYGIVLSVLLGLVGKLIKTCILNGLL